MITAVFLILLGLILTVISLKEKKEKKEKKENERIFSYNEAMEVKRLSPVVSEDTPPITPNDDGTFFSNKKIEGKSSGSLALSSDERLSFAKSGLHDTGLTNGYGQPLVQDEEGRIWSVCRMLPSSITIERGFPVNTTCVFGELIK